MSFDPTDGERIELRGLRVMARCGVLPEEQRRPQPFEIDVDVALDLSPAGISDALEDTLDYGELCDRLVSAAGAVHHQLMERLAAVLADVALRDARARAVRVTVRKLRPPVALDLRTAGVTVVRAR